MQRKVEIRDYVGERVGRIYIKHVRCVKGEEV
jgi:hypothetical protein